MKLKDALASGNFKKVVFKSYSQKNGEEYVYDKADIIEGKVVNGFEDYSPDENIIIYQNDWDDPDILIVYIRTIQTNKFHSTKEYQW